MSLFITSLNSGSNANCYYVGNGREAVLIDAGLSCRETEKRLARLGLSIKDIKAIFISHEHSDHIKGVEVLSRKHQLPVYITPRTQQSGGLAINDARGFTAHIPTMIGDLGITAFPKSHDAADAHSFIIEHAGVTVGVFTDIGYSCEHVLSNFKKCHAIFLEANYDEQMLQEGPYPFYLKRRISDDKGHLSNTQALQLFREHRPPFMSHVLLSHLSQNNNSPQLVYKLFAEHANGAEVVVASRDYETPVFHITGGQPLAQAENMPANVQTAMF